MRHFSAGQREKFTSLVSKYGHLLSTVVADKNSDILDNILDYLIVLVLSDDLIRESSVSFRDA